MAQYVLVAPLNRLDVGDGFSISAWPLHVTIVSNFTSDLSVEEIATLLRPGARAMDVVAGHEDRFGPRHNVRVTVVEHSDELATLHARLVAELVASGASTIRNTSGPDTGRTSRPRSERGPRAATSFISTSSRSWTCGRTATRGFGAWCGRRRCPNSVAQSARRANQDKRLSKPRSAGNAGPQLANLIVVRRSITMASIGRDTQSSIYRNGAIGRRPLVPAEWNALEAAARSAMSPAAWAYTRGSSGAETTLAANSAAFDRWHIVPRMLRDVSERDLSIDLFGRRYASPVIAAPIGVLELAHRDADLGIARAAGALGIPYIASNQASMPLEETFAATPGDPHWFQLYWSSSDELVHSLVSRAERAGAEAIVITLDTHMLGWRPRDLDLAYLPFAHGMGIAQYTSDPVFRQLVASRPASSAQRPRISPAVIRTLVEMTRHYPGGFWANLRSPEPRAAVDTFLDVFSRSSLTWENLALVRGMTDLPILLKGIQHPDDAELALAHGMDGIIVSNHGGRQLDRAVGSLDALPAIVERIAGRVPVLFDSGVRGGSDVLVALALGARAVLVGRPWVYGLAIAGAAGAEAVLRNVLADFDLALGLSGHRSVAELGPGCLTRYPV